MWSVNRSNTLERCFNLQENGEGETQHWLLLLGNAFCSRCTGAVVLSASITMHDKSSAVLWCFGEPGISPMLPLFLWLPSICIWEANITWAKSVDSEKLGALWGFLECHEWLCWANSKRISFFFQEILIFLSVPVRLHLFICAYTHTCLLPSQMHSLKYHAPNSLMYPVLVPVE